MPWGSGAWGIGSWGIGGASGANLGFEDAGPSPGIPDQWTLITTITALVYIEFTDPAPAAVEVFNWGNVIITSPLFSDVVFTGLADEETFDSWIPGGLITAPVLTAVTFTAVDPEVEDFETGWNNDSYLLDFVGIGTDLTAVTFTGPSDVEDFEDGWGNDSYLTDFVGVGTDLTALVFDGTSPSSSDIEDFEEVKIDDAVFVNPANDDILLTGPHGRGVNEKVFFTNVNGNLPSGLLSEPTPWFIQAVPAGDRLRVAPLSSAVSPQDITDFGTGSHSIRFDPAWFWRVII